MKGQLQTRHQQGLPDAWVFMDLIIWMSVSILPQRKQAELQTSSPGHHWSPPGNQQHSPKCLRSANTFFFPQWNKPQTFLSFCKNKICTKGFNLNENLTGFGWLCGVFPRCRRSTFDVLVLSPSQRCFPLGTQIQISHLWSHCHTIVIMGQSISTSERGYSQNLSSQIRVSQHCETDKT